jgi:hypothetical protein
VVANGAPGDMPDAVYHYNLSSDYVVAVRAYAGHMSPDPRAFFFYYYYYWEVILARTGGLLILPRGVPARSRGAAGPLGHRELLSIESNVGRAGR